MALFPGTTATLPFGFVHIPHRRRHMPIQRTGRRNLGGNGRVRGTTYLEDNATPWGNKLVVLYDGRSRVLLRTTISDANGDYEFNDLPSGPDYPYTVIAHDLTGSQRAVCSDYQFAEVV